MKRKLFISTLLLLSSLIPFRNVNILKILLHYALLEIYQQHYAIAILLIVVKTDSRFFHTRITGF